MMTENDFALETPAGLLYLSPQKAVFVPGSRSLLLADLHLGKAQHFRKHGLPIPPMAAHQDVRALHALISQYHPAQVFFLGDLFHSDHNHEWELLHQVLQAYPHTRFYLVPGNHDILHRQQYAQAGLEVLPEIYRLDQLLLSHTPLAQVPADLLNIHGHIHPGYLLQGKGRQSVQLPCFVKDQQHLLLPAFGALTGTVRQHSTTATYYLVLPDRVVSV